MTVSNRRIVLFYFRRPRFQDAIVVTIVVCFLSAFIKLTMDSNTFSLELLRMESCLQFDGPSSVDATRKKKRKKLNNGGRLCTMEEARHGQWLPEILDTLPFIPTKSKCYPEEIIYETPSWKYYSWHPFASMSETGKTTTGSSSSSSSSSSSPPNEPCDYSSEWDRDLFCKLAYNKTIALMGDSLTWEQFASLAGLNGLRGLGAHNEMSFRMNGQMHNQNSGMIFSICDENNNDNNHNHNQTTTTTTTTTTSNTRIAFLRHRYLDGLKRFIEFSNPDILILNRGAHIVPDKDLIETSRSSTGINDVASILSKWQEDCGNKRNHNKQQQQQQEGGGCLAIWRTTAPGHPYCEKYTEPATSVKEMERVVESQENNNIWKYNHRKFKPQNKLILDAFHQNISSTTTTTTTTTTKKKLHFDVLHGYELGILRPDSHPSAEDCLHHCDPGMVDAYNVMLLHLLRLHYGGGSGGGG